ncbi:MAG: hypothetical protein ACTSX8_08840 [Alphaproteobacteria bacterium]
MTRFAAEQPADEALQRLATSLDDDCARLLALLEELARAAPDGIEKAYERRRDEARRVRARITAAAVRLQRHRQSVAAMPPRGREHARQAQAALRNAYDLYGILISQVAEMMDAVRKNLEGLQQGGKAVRGYACAAVVTLSRPG